MSHIYGNVVVGMEAADLVKYIFLTKGLTQLDVVKYALEEIPHFAEVKGKNPKAKRPISNALQHKSDFEGTIISFHHQVDIDYLKGLLSNLRDIDQGQVQIQGYLEKPDQKVWIHEALTVLSRVRTRQGYFHIPLLDMDLPINEAGPNDAEEAVRGLGIQHGAILNSGKSYHFWGLELLSEVEWKTFMYRALLLDRVDSRWIGHRLLDGHANLRISQKRGQVPIVEHVF